MRKLIIWDMVTVDGFFEGPDRDISWFVFEGELETIFVRPRKRPTR